MKVGIDVKYSIIKAGSNDIDYLKKTKLYNIFAYAHNLPESEILKINAYVDKKIPVELNEYKIIKFNKKRIGCYLVVKKDDGVMLDEIFLETDFRNKGIGSDIINRILELNDIVYLWVYKDNIKAIRLYKKFGFKIIYEADTRYYMKYSK